ncbi:MAG: DNA-binding domain-containing protein [Sedimenticolaceae bacterium]
MQALRNMQQRFLGHLLGQGGEAIDFIQSSPQASAQQRLDIYATGYRLRLKEALQTDYEKLHAYLGDALFDRLMDAYIDRYPSQATSLRDYSRHMDGLLKSLPPYCDVPVLVEIERIERAFNHSFDAADSEPLRIDALADVPPANWPTMCLGFHASLCLLSNRYNSFPIWQALSNDQVPPEVVDDPVSWLVWRKDLISRYRALSEAEACALRTAISGGNFGELCEGLLAYHAAEDVPQQAVIMLQTWIAEKMVNAIEHDRWSRA